MIENSNIDRIFFIEPNLIKGMGHVVEFPISLNKYFENSPKIYFNANKNVYSTVRNKIEGLSGRISKTCFEKLDSNGRYFCDDLKNIDNEYHFTSNDLVVVLTSYWNEIRGSYQYLNRIEKNLPGIVLWIHQIYPPSDEFEITIQKKYKQKIKISWKDTLKNIHNKMFLACTPSLKMKHYFDSLVDSKKNMNILPLPYEQSKRTTKDNGDQIKISFLGDGRYEKGLLLFLNAVQDIPGNNKIFIQNISPRGYSSKERKEFDFQLQELIKRDNVIIYNKPRFPDKFMELVLSSSLIVLPYHPYSYDKRVSGIFIQAMRSGIPCVVSEGTWMADEIDRSGSGVVFKYNITRGCKHNSTSLRNAILNATDKIQLLKHRALTNSVSYKKEYSPNNFVDSLLKITD